MYQKNNSFYDSLNITCATVNHLDIPIDTNWKRIGVNLSGGADSALMTYLLCKIIQQHKMDCRIDVITYQRCWETRPWQGFISFQVFSWLKEKFPDIIDCRHLQYIPPELEHGVAGPIIDGRSGDQIMVGSYNKFVAYEYSLDAVYNATSKNPDDLRDDRMKNRDKDAEDGNMLDVWMPIKKVDAVFVHPFKFVKKDWIVAQYYMLNILDLYKLTRSCEGDINHHTVIKNACGHFKDYKPGMDMPICNECWWCKERAWAESRVDQVIEEINEFRYN